MSAGNVLILDNFEQDRTVTQNIRVMSSAAYLAWKPEFERFMPTESTDLPYETVMHYEGTAPASARSETSASGIRRDIKEGYKFTANLKHYAAEVTIGMHQRKFARQDHKFLKNIADYLTRSMTIAQEYEGANVLNNGFDSTYTGGDSVCFFNASHPWKSGGTYDNTLASASAGKTTLETAYQGVAGAKMEYNIPAMLMVKKLVFGTSNYFVIPEIYNSMYNPETNVNARNMLETEKPNLILCHYLTDTDSYYLGTQEDAMVMYEAGGVTPDSYMETSSTRYQVEAVNQFCGATFTHPLRMFGSQGV